MTFDLIAFQVCANTQTGVTHQPAITFWSYLLVRVLLGVLTAASLMMFEGAVMATIQGCVIIGPIGLYSVRETADILHRMTLDLEKLSKRQAGQCQVIKSAVA